MEEFVFWDARANARHDDGWMGVQQEQGKSEIYLLEEAEKKTRRRNIIYTRKQAERQQDSQVKSSCKEVVQRRTVQPTTCLHTCCSLYVGWSMYRRHTRVREDRRYVGACKAVGASTDMVVMLDFSGIMADVGIRGISRVGEYTVI